MSGPSHSRKSVNDYTSSPVRFNTTPATSEESSREGSYHSTSRSVTPTAALPVIHQEVRNRHTTRVQTGPSGGRLDPRDPYASPSTRVSDRYTWEYFMNHSASRSSDSGPSRPVMGVPANFGLTPTQLQDIQNMSTDLHGLARYSEDQAQLLFAVSESTRQLAEHVLRTRASSEMVARVVQNLVVTCIVLGVMLLVVVVKLILDSFR